MDPEWKPKETVTSPDPEGEIAKLEGQAREAEDRLAEVTGVGIKPPPLGGHHYATRMLFDDFENLPLREDTRKVFDEARSGPLLDRSVNFFTAEHRAYSDAVEDAFRSFLAEKEISSEEMTPDQAREFLYEIFRSTDPRIHDFNMRIFEQRKLYLDRLLGIKDPKE